MIHNMSVHSYTVPDLPLVIPAGMKKEDEYSFYHSVISSFFWRRLYDIYQIELAKGNVAAYRKKIGHLVESNKNIVGKLVLYKNETLFLKALRSGFEEKVFFPSFKGSKKNEKEMVYLEKVALKNGSIDTFRKVWVGVLSDVKDNLPKPIYDKYLTMFADLYLSLMSKKTSHLNLEIFELIPVIKSNQHYLNLIEHLDLTDKSVRDIIVKKLDEFEAKGCSLVDTIKYLRKNIGYSEFDKYTDIYKNFDNGFTDSLVVEENKIVKIKVDISQLEKTFPILNNQAKHKKYNELLNVFYSVLYNFNVETLVIKNFGEKEKNSDVEEAYVIVLGDGKINGVAILEIMEEVLLFLTEKINEEDDLNKSMDNAIKQGKVYLEGLLLELTIPKNDLSSKENLLKW